MAHRAPRIPEDRWEHHKPTIRSLYLDQNLKLMGSDGLIRLMETKYGFSATKAQYENHFKKWNLAKNYSQEDWNIVGRKIEKRAQAKKASEVLINGKQISAAKIQKQIGRYKPKFELSPRTSSPQTPDGFIIRTPEPEALMPMFHLPDSPCPWLHLSFLSYDLPFSQLQFDLPSQINGPKSSGIIEPAEFIDPKILHLVQNDTFNLVRPFHANSGFFRPSPSTIAQRGFGSEQIYSMQKSLLPASLRYQINTHSDPIALEDDLSNAFTRLSLFSLANNIVSLHGDHYRETLKYLKNPKNMQIFRHFRFSPGPETEAIAEKLLGIAIENKDAELVEFLLQNIILDLNGLVLINRMTPIELAAYLGSPQIVKVLLNFGADVHKPVKIGTGKWGGALNIAIRENFRWNDELSVSFKLSVDLRLVRMLLEAGAPVGVETLKIAIFQENPGLVRLLIDYRVQTKYADWILGGTLCDIVAKLYESSRTETSSDDGSECSFLEDSMEAFDNNFIICMVKRIALPENIEACKAFHDISKPLNHALNEAARHGNIELVQFFLKNGGLITNKTLKKAVVSCNLELIRFLYRNGAECSLDWPMLRWAVAGGHFKVAQFLIEKGGSEIVHDKALIYAIPCTRPGNLELVRLLLEAGAKADSYTTRARHRLGGFTTPFSSAILLEDPQILNLLLEYGAWNRIKEKNQFKAALGAAAAVGDIPMARNLLDCRPNFFKGDLEFPLAAAVHYDHKELAFIVGSHVIYDRQRHMTEVGHIARRRVNDS